MKNILSLLIIILILSVSCKKDESEPEINYTGNCLALTSTSDGGILTKVSTEQLGIAITKFDENCNKEWEKGYSWGKIPSCDLDCGAVTVEKAFEAEDHNYFILYSFSYYASPYSRYFLVKLDHLGNELLKKDIYFEESYFYFNKTKDGFIGFDAYNQLILFDEYGSIISNSSLTELEDLDIVYRTLNYELNNIIFITKNDTVNGFEKHEYSFTGNLINTKKYTLNLDSLNLKYNPGIVMLLVNEDLIIYGITNDDKSLLARINKSSDLIWSKKIDERYYSYPQQCISDNEFLFQSGSNIICWNIEGELLGSKEIARTDNYFFQNNDFVFQLFLRNGNEYYATKVPLNEFFN
jgi:hypothetical protein